MLSGDGGESHRLVVDIYPRGAVVKNSKAKKDSSVAVNARAAKDDVTVKKAAQSAASSEPELPAATAVKALKVADGAGRRDVIIAIDAGHGGDDPGAIGPGRLEEKRVALAIAKELAAIVGRERGYKAVLTRNGDYFLPLKTRRDLARKAQADLMISVHADAFSDRDAQGGSVFALSDRGATSTMAAFLAASENEADAIGGVSTEGKDDDLVKVLADLSLTATMDSSLRIGRHVLNSLGGVTRLHTNRVEQAAFVVLKSPDTPSILVETGFVSNPQEARRLASSDHQEQIARAIFSGVNRYFSQNPPPNTYLAWVKRNGRPPAATDSLASAEPEHSLPR
jgi:N-acetylmuramoyl-L-alanine amidase